MKSLIPCFTTIEPLTDPEHSRAPCSHSSTPVFRTFNSLFDHNAVEDSTTSHYPKPEPHPVLGPDSESESEPDFAAAFASQRFFFSSPGRSNSITESCPSAFTIREDSTGSSPSISCSSSSNKFMEIDGRDDSCSRNQAVEDSVAVDTYSPDPYVDFRRSMEEMVDARGLQDVRASWEKLHELLLCYLALNPDDAHRYIVRAFADLLVTLMSSKSSSPREYQEDA